jgi:GT2 family glycosyltransferase
MIIPLVPLKISCDKICKNEIDVVIPYSNAYSVKRSILNYVMSGEVNFNKILSDKNNILKKMEVTAGGCIILATSIAKHIKGINERFFVWGGEDDEFFLRLIKLGFRICKFSNSPMMHIQHVRTKNCKPNPKYYGSNIMEKNKSISMNKADLCGYYGITEKVCDYVKQEKPRPGETVTKRDAPVTIPDPQY